MRPEGYYLKLLRQGDLDRAGLEGLLSDRSARKFHAVRRALASHPRTPRREALSLVSTLYWRDLAQISADSLVHPEVRRAADRDLLRRLPEMALAERVDLAKTVGRGVLMTLRLDPDPRVLAALLENRFLTEPDVVVAAARADALPESLAVVAGHPRWSVRPGVRSALLRNPNLPGRLALALLTLATRDDLEGLVAAPGTPRFLRLCAQRVLAQRRGEDYDQSS